MGAALMERDLARRRVRDLKRDLARARRRRGIGGVKAGRDVNAVASELRKEQARLRDLEHNPVRPRTQHSRIEADPEIKAVVAELHRLGRSARALDRNFARPLGSGLARQLLHDAESAAIYDHQCAIALELANKIVADLDQLCIRTRGRVVASDIDRAHRRSLRLAREVERVPLTRDVTAAAASAGQQLITLAVWLLPAEHRARYLEEFRAEHADVPGKYRYAGRLLLGSWQVRRARRDGGRGRRR